MQLERGPGACGAQSQNKHSGAGKNGLTIPNFIFVFFHQCYPAQFFFYGYLNLIVYFKKNTHTEAKVWTSAPRSIYREVIEKFYYEGDNCELFSFDSRTT